MFLLYLSDGLGSPLVRKANCEIKYQFPPRPLLFQEHTTLAATNYNWQQEQMHNFVF